MLGSKMRNLIKISCFIVILIVMAAAPYYLPRYYLSILRRIIVWAALSISWYFFSALTKYISLGSVAFAGLGIYFTALYMNRTYYGYWDSPFLPFPAVVILAGLICFALGLAIGLVSLRIKGIYFAIATFGISQIIGGFIRWWQTKAGIYQIYRIPGFTDIKIQYYSILITTIAISLLIILLLRSKIGLALRMIGECEEVAAHTGVNTTLYKVLGFAISTLFMGLIGGSYMISFSTVNVDNAFDIEYSFLPPVMVLLGGAGTIYGPVIGSTVITLLNEQLRRALASYFPILYGGILIIIVVFMPNGIMGAVEKVKSIKFLRGKLAKPAP